MKSANSTKHHIKRGACLPVCIPLTHKSRNAENRVQKSIKKCRNNGCKPSFLFEQSTPGTLHTFRSRHRRFALAKV